MPRLNQQFYLKPTVQVASALIGKYLVRKFDQREIAGQIVETEAYVGLKDKACHACRGKTLRNEVMFGSAGFWYVYLVYGMYHCLNIVTAEKDQPEAVLIRALYPSQGIDFMKKRAKSKEVARLCSGPGKLCSCLAIDKQFNQTKAFGSKTKLWIEDRGDLISLNQIKATARVGVDYAGPYWAARKWRFYLKDSSAVSKK